MTAVSRTSNRLRGRFAARRPSLLTILAAAALAASLVFSLTTLTRFPGLYGDESWIGSTAWSLLNGHGFRPSLAVGGGPYDNGALDFWLPRIGTAPFILAEAIAGPSYWAYRFAAFVLGVAALAVFALTLRRRYGTATATLAGLALSLTWGFFSASHYIRWDSLGFLVSCAVLGVLIRGAPGLRASLSLGVALGLMPDIEGAVLAVFPAVVLLLAWERRARLQRLVRFGFGFGGGVIVAMALHEFPYFRDDGGQWARVYEPAYKIPLEQALKLKSLSPIRGEKQRWNFMHDGLLGDRLGLYVLLLGLSAFVVVLVARRARAAYPVHLVAGLLLASHLAGLALIAPNKPPIHAWYALPFAIAAILEALRQFSGRRWVPAAGVAVLALILVPGIREMRDATPAEPTFTSQFRQAADAAIRPGESVLGDYLYWWGFKNEDYHWNSWIWNDRWAHRTSFEQAFNRLCPDVVIYDDVWRARYQQGAAFGKRFPSMAPTDPTEVQAIGALLQREYTLASNSTINGRNIQFWRRQPGACDGILTNGGGTS